LIEPWPLSLSNELTVPKSPPEVGHDFRQDRMWDGWKDYFPVAREG
jgi:hypothetical protein